MATRSRREFVAKTKTMPHLLALIDDLPEDTEVDRKLKQTAIYAMQNWTPMQKRQGLIAKNELLDKFGGAGDHIMDRLGFLRQRGSHDAFAVSANNPIRLFWYSYGNHIVAKSTQPCTGNDVAEVVHFVAQRIKAVDAGLLPHIRFHINSGSHGDRLGVHANPDQRWEEAEEYIEPTFVAEDIVASAFAVEAKVSITNLATQSRKIPESAFLVVDAFCWSGRGHHHYPLPEGHDPRIGEHVELIEHFDLAPFYANECWGCSDGMENWEDACLQSGKCICVRACANMSLEHAKQILRNSKDFAAFCHVGGDREGLLVTRGPYRGQVLAHGSVIFFKDGFRYWFGGCNSKQEVTTITKEPKMMRGA